MFVLFTIPLAAQAELSSKQILNNIYKEYDQKHQCWITISEEQRYCLKIDREDHIKADTGQRLYLLMAGDAVDEQGEVNGGHVTSGLIAAFIIEEQNGKTEIIASESDIQMGSYGSAPTQWQLIKLGAGDYWGWKNTHSYGNQGIFGGRYALLAPYGKKIRDIANLPSDYTNGGACREDDEKKCAQISTEIESKLSVDDSDPNAKVYPLKITVTGRVKGKELPAKTWTLPFDTKKWFYIEPADWALKDLDL